VLYQREMCSHRSQKEHKICVYSTKPREVFERAFLLGSTAPGGPGLAHYQGFTIILRHTTLGRSPLDERSARHTDLYLTRENSHKRQDSHGPGGIRTRNPGNPLAADPSIRPRSHCGRHLEELSKKNRISDYKEPRNPR
jgi:hypothetical protein